MRIKALYFFYCFILFGYGLHAQSEGQWGVCEFANLTALNAFDPSASNWKCKLAYVQASNGHYEWNGSAWAKVATYTIYDKDGILTSNRTVTLDGKNLTFEGSEDVIIQSDGKVGIGTNSPNTQLEVDKGTVRFSTYGDGNNTGANTYLLGVDGDGDVVEIDQEWVEKAGKVFYPPALAIDVSSTGSGRTLDLYTQYKGLFTTPAVASSGAPAAIPTFAATDLYYYVTDFDGAVFDNVSINASGVMTYNVIASPSDNCSVVNVIFVVK